MRIGGSIVLGVIGAILYFAVEVDVAGISISVIGVIMMVAAALWLILELVNSSRGDKVDSVETVKHSDGSVEQKRSTVEESGPNV